MLFYIYQYSPECRRHSPLVGLGVVLEEGLHLRPHLEAEEGEDGGGVARGGRRKVFVSYHTEMKKFKVTK